MYTIELCVDIELPTFDRPTAVDDSEQPFHLHIHFSHN